MPFITEALWQELPRKGDALMVAPWPKVDNGALFVDSEAIIRCKRTELFYFDVVVVVVLLVVLLWWHVGSIIV